MTRSLTLKVFAAAFGIALAAGSLPAKADYKNFLKAQYFDVDCAQLFCGYIKSNPKVRLLSVNPDPLPTVNPGDSQTVNLSWTVEMGLKTSFELCLTDSPSASPAPADGCVALTGSNITSSNNRYVNFAETVTIPGGLRRAEAGFYIRSTATIYVYGSTPNQQVSNRLPFEWPHPLTNLQAERAGVDFPSSGQIFAKTRIYNTTNIPASQVEVDLYVAYCDGNQPASLRPGTTKRDDILCHNEAENFLGQFYAGRETIPYIAGHDYEPTQIDITTSLPASPRNLWITVIAVADPDDRIKESNESATDNIDDGTGFVPRP